jgi:hypothetical protein
MIARGLEGWAWAEHQASKIVMMLIVCRIVDIVGVADMAWLIDVERPGLASPNPSPGLTPMW